MDRSYILVNQPESVVDNDSAADVATLAKSSMRSSAVASTGYQNRRFLQKSMVTALAVK